MRRLLVGIALAFTLTLAAPKPAVAETQEAWRQIACLALDFYNNGNITTAWDLVTTDPTLYYRVGSDFYVWTMNLDPFPSEEEQNAWLNFELIDICHGF